MAAVFITNGFTKGSQYVAVCKNAENFSQSFDNWQTKHVMTNMVCLCWFLCYMYMCMFDTTVWKYFQKSVKTASDIQP